MTNLKISPGSNADTIDVKAGNGNIDEAILLDFDTDSSASRNFLEESDQDLERNLSPGGEDQRVGQHRQGVNCQWFSSSGTESILEGSAAERQFLKYS